MTRTRNISSARPCWNREGPGKRFPTCKPRRSLVPTSRTCTISCRSLTARLAASPMPIAKPNSPPTARPSRRRPTQRNTKSRLSLLPSARDCYTSLFMLKDILEPGRIVTDQALERLLPPPTQFPTSIHQAMPHSVCKGGKRLRPILCMEAARVVAVSVPHGVEELGSALEMLHTYSLIHDDLPALDNDDLRRGRPTCHKVFGDAIAILAGDGLQTYAYEVLANLQRPAEARVAIIAEVAHATGTIDGMIGGQVMDLEAEHQHPDAKTLEYIHRSKTGALLTASVVTGGLYAGGDASQVQSLRDFGMNIGLAFQIVDDVLDVTQTSEQLGKTAGKDTATEKATYPSLFGIDASIKKADELVKNASNALDRFGDNASDLREIAAFLVERKK